MPGRLVARFSAIVLLIAVAAIGNDATLPSLEGWPQRAEALERYKRLAPKQITDDIRIQTIRWLSSDADAARAQFEATGNGAGEAFGEYYIDLVLFVVKLKDPRSIIALVKAMDVAASVSTTLAEFGDPAVQPVLDATTDRYLKSDAAYTLGKFIHGRTLGVNHLSAASVAKIRGALIALAHDETPAVRASAVAAIGYFKSDRKLLQVVRGLATSDAATRKTDAGEIYPVRRAAKKVLDKWAAK